MTNKKQASSIDANVLAYPQGTKARSGNLPDSHQAISKKFRSIGLGTALLASGLGGLSSATAATIAQSSDVEFVVGTGANQATLIIDFNDGFTTESFAWGYQWDGVASGADMFLAVAGADPRLSPVSFGTGLSGFFISSIDYDDDTDRHSEAGGSFVTFPNDYVSWSYYLSGGFAGDDTPGAGGTPLSVAGGGLNLPTAWTSSPVGAPLDSFGESGRILSDGAWDAWSFGPNSESFAHLAPPGPEAPFAAVVPEPNSTLCILSALTGFIFLRRRS